MSEKEQDLRVRVNFSEENVARVPKEDEEFTPREEEKLIIKELRPEQYYINEEKLDPKFPVYTSDTDFPLEYKEHFGRQRLMPDDDFRSQLRTLMPDVGDGPEWWKIGRDVSMQEGHDHETPAFKFTPEQMETFYAWLIQYLAQHPLKIDPDLSEIKGASLKRQPILKPEYYRSLTHPVTLTHPGTPEDNAEVDQDK